LAQPENSTLDQFAVRLHPEGWRFVALFALVALVLYWLWAPLGLLGVLATAWCAYFFRDPLRVTPERAGLVVSPADGIVQTIVTAPPPPELAMGDAALTRISIFMNVFNVHVNRIPIGATIVDRVAALRLRTGDGRELALVQIAGLVARRIRCDAEPNRVMRTGERFGLIRFGSRVDVYLPDGVAPLVIEGQTMIAGETPLADLTSQEAARQGTRA